MQGKKTQFPLGYKRRAGIRTINSDFIFSHFYHVISPEGFSPIPEDSSQNFSGKNNEKK